MKLKNLNIHLGASYDDNPGQYTATIEYENKDCNHKLVLDVEISEKILAFIGPVITASALKLSRQLEANLQDSLTSANTKQITEITGVTLP